MMIAQGSTVKRRARERTIAVIVGDITETLDSIQPYAKRRAACKELADPYIREPAKAAAGRAKQ
jgi:hypothetical protein